jgi:hypothetical protein
LPGPRASGWRALGGEFAPAGAAAWLLAIKALGGARREARSQIRTLRLELALFCAGAAGPAKRQAPEDRAAELRRASEAEASGGESRGAG